jgi:DNA-binding NtrC family response regulator
MQFLYELWLSEFVLESCQNEREAQDAIKQQHYHLVILDIDLGEGPTGLNILNQIAQQHPALKVLVISFYLNQFQVLQGKYPQYVYLNKEEATPERVREEVNKLIEEISP